jgi:hypothetical protein
MKIKTYIMAVSVFLGSFLAIYFLPLPDIVKSLFSIPAMGGLFAVIFQNWREQVAFDREQELLKVEKEYDFAIKSHMANVMFDKQVSFAEEYSAKLINLLKLLHNYGPTKGCSTYVRELKDIRFKYIQWISKELSRKLFRLELILQEITSSIDLLDKDINITDWDRINDAMYKKIGTLLGFDISTPAVNKEEALEKTIQEFTLLLGTQELESLRKKEMFTKHKDPRIKNRIGVRRG